MLMEIRTKTGDIGHITGAAGESEMESKKRL
jgi:hypothetical protein